MVTMDLISLDRLEWRNREEEIQSQTITEILRILNDINIHTQKPTINCPTIKQNI